MKLVYFSDAHLRATTPRNRKDDYYAEMIHLFEQISEIIHREQIEAVLNGGDLFDSPEPAQSILNEYIQLFGSWEIPIYSVVGSHDKYGYNDTTLNRTALGTLIAAGLTEIVNDTIWIGNNCQLAGVSHSYHLDDDPANYHRTRFSDDFMIQLCHGMLLDTPFFGKYTLTSQIQTDADLVLSGHVHNGYGPIKYGNTTFLNIGSLGRMERVPRKYTPGIVMIDTDGPDWKYIALKCAADKDVFVEVEKQDNTTPQDMQEFINNLRDKAGAFKENRNIKDLVVAVGEQEGHSKETIKETVVYIERCMTES